MTLLHADSCCPCVALRRVSEARALLGNGQEGLRGVRQSLQGDHGLPQAQQEPGELGERHAEREHQNDLLVSATRDVSIIFHF